MKFNKIKFKSISSIELNLFSSEIVGKNTLHIVPPNDEPGIPKSNKPGHTRDSQSSKDYTDLVKQIQELKIEGNFSKIEQQSIAVIEEKIIMSGGVKNIENNTLKKIAGFLEVLSDKSDKSTMELPNYKDIIKDLNENLEKLHEKDIALQPKYKAPNSNSKNVGRVMDK